MARTKDKKTLAKMGLLTNGLDKYKIDRKNCGKNDQNNRKKCDNDKPKRVRRTHEQLLADGYYKDDKQKKKKTTDNSAYFKSNSLTVEEVSERQIAKAKERGLDNWEQDFRNDYESGQRIYYVEVNPLCHSKEVLELYVGTVYAKTMIAWIEKGEAHPISMEDADKIFLTEKEAKKCYQKIKL